MIKVSVLYPVGAGSRFDMDYYLATHIPLVGQRLGAAMKKAEIDQGLAGGAPGAPAPFMAAAHMYFDSVEAFQGAFGPHAAEIMGDLPNFTNAQPVLQISQIRQ